MTVKKSRRLLILTNSAAMMIVGASLVVHSQFVDGAVPRPDASRIFGAGCMTRSSSGSGCTSSWSCSNQGVWTDLAGSGGGLAYGSLPLCSGNTCGQYSVLTTCSGG